MVQRLNVHIQQLLLWHDWSRFALPVVQRSDQFVCLVAHFRNQCIIQNDHSRVSDGDVATIGFQLVLPRLVLYPSALPRHQWLLLQWPHFKCSHFLHSSLRTVKEKSWLKNVEVCLAILALFQATLHLDYDDCDADALRDWSAFWYCLLWAFLVGRWDTELLHGCFAFGSQDANQRAVDVRPLRSLRMVEPQATPFNRQHWERGTSSCFQQKE